MKKIKITFQFITYDQKKAKIISKLKKYNQNK
jgi:hypothetical protein